MSSDLQQSLWVRCGRELVGGDVTLTDFRLGSPAAASHACHDLHSKSKFGIRAAILGGLAVKQIEHVTVESNVVYMSENVCIRVDF